MRALYGRRYNERYEALANLIQPNSTVLDICSGPGVLYGRYLSKLQIKYTGLDLNPTFIGQVKAFGGTGVVTDVRNAPSFPEADFVIMQASLYHFLPDPAPILTKMFIAAKKALIIAEPISNFASTDFWPIKKMAGSLTDPGTGPQMLRFTENSLDDLLNRTFDRPIRVFQIAGGREKIYFLPTFFPQSEKDEDKVEVETLMNKRLAV